VASFVWSPKAATASSKDQPDVVIKAVEDVLDLVSG
jgi:hypothetical protein